MDEHEQNQLFFAGLKALAEAAFPKHCNYCGRVFSTAEEFLLQTKTIRKDITGLKQSVDDDDVTIVEAYRNCLCGSTLMDVFSDRRDISAAGQHRRELFKKLLPHLQEKGMRPGEARDYLLNVLRGQK
ncbi:oxidoreductase [Oxalobacteraceae bacterium]|nr:oxidoreductase [Oxalobacteraceae bacterium]